MNPARGARASLIAVVLVSGGLVLAAGVGLCLSVGACLGSQPGSVSGTVSADGQPVGKAEVTLEFVESRYVRSATTDAAGVFHMKGVPTDGNFWITVGFGEEIGTSAGFLTEGLPESEIAVEVGAVQDVTNLEADQITEIFHIGFPQEPDPPSVEAIGDDFPSVGDNADLPLPGE